MWEQTIQNQFFTCPPFVPSSAPVSLLKPRTICHIYTTCQIDTQDWYEIKASSINELNKEGLSALIARDVSLISLTKEPLTGYKKGSLNREGGSSRWESVNSLASRPLTRNSNNNKTKEMWEQIIQNKVSTCPPFAPNSLPVILSRLVPN